VAPYALGADIFLIDELIDRVEEKEHKFPASYLKRAMAGVDTALWALHGKRERRPVIELLGGKLGRLRCYASSMKRDITPEEETQRFRRLRDQHGFDAFTFRVGAEFGRDVDKWRGRTEAIVPAIRKVLGPEVHLLVDANSGFSPARAIQVGRLLEAESIEHYEEPCLYWELKQTKQVADALPVAVTGGEQDCELATWRRICELPAVDIVQPDILYAGGIGRTMRIARIAAAMDLPVTPHSANLGLVTLFTMHLLPTLPKAGKYLELSVEEADYYPWQYGLFRHDPYRVVDGHVTMPSEPGWRVEIKPDWLARATYQAREDNW
jgi:L-alanine-DL-glutamate epimerase-like enolase superfamily enzyme